MLRCLGLLLLLSSCASSSSRGSGERGAEDDGAEPAKAVAAAQTLDAGLAAPAPLHPYTTVDDLGAIAELERSGAAFATLAGRAYLAPIRDHLRAQAQAIARKDPNAGVGIRGNSHRLFNTRWLDDGQLELIGLTYRSERIPFDDGRCGDVRLIYRLAYRTEVSGEQVHSRLPMTILVELAAAQSKDKSCAAEARRWLSEKPLSGKELGEFLVKGPLANRLDRSQISQILVNAQIVRWPSAVRPSLGGHAEYSMFGFAPDPSTGALRPKKLENMPDLGALQKDPGLRDELLRWIGDNLHDIDTGTAILPDRFLALEALSVTPRGLSRRANRPFRQLYSAADFDSLQLQGRQRIGSPEALLRRLDDLSCVGCHQSRTIAGFHWLGLDDEEVAVGNALHVGRSVPLQGDARRRDAYALDLAAGRRPNFSRPFAERDDNDPGIVGSHCGLGDPGFASWTCGEGLRCDPYDAPKDDQVVGVCAGEEIAGPGEACEVVALQANADPHRDRAKNASMRRCAHGVCNINRTGFPGGMCTSSCGDLGEEGSCGVIALLTPFNNCLARKTPFPSCLADHVRPAGLRSCDAEHPCRDDYVCSRTPDGEGGCMPPYFLFQLRVDGHP